MHVKALRGRERLLLVHCAMPTPARCRRFLPATSRRNTGVMHRAVELAEQRSRSYKLRACELTGNTDSGQILPFSARESARLEPVMN
jgi:hypothetical protein